MSTTMFGSRAAADVATITSEGTASWARLVRSTVEQGGDPTIQELRAAAPHLDDLGHLAVIERFNADCGTVRGMLEVEADLARCTKLAAKARKPDVIMAEINALEAKIDKLKAEFELADGWHTAVETKRLELKRLHEAHPHLGARS